MIFTFLQIYALNTFWQLPLLVFAATAVNVLLRPALLTRHLLWIASLLFAVLLPLRGISLRNTLPQQRISAHPLPTLPLHLVHLPAASIRVLTLLYALSIVLAALMLIRSALGLRSLLAASKPLLLTPFQQHTLHRLSALFRVEPPELRIHPDAHASPQIARLRAPVLLLPSSLARVSGPQFQAILAHELAHLARRDLLVNLLLRAVSIPIAYHPFAHLLHSRIRHTRELLCDRRAAAAVGSHTTYAQALLSLSRSLLMPSQHQTLSLFPPNPTHLEDRIMQLTHPAVPSRPALRIAVASTLCLLAVGAAATLHLTPPVHAATHATVAAMVVPQSAEPVTQQPAPMPAVQPAPVSQVQVPAAPEPTASPRAQPAPAPPVAPLPPAEPLAPLAPHAPLAPLAPLPSVQMQLNAEQQEQIQQQMKDAQKQLAEANRQFNSPEFRRQMADAQRQLAEASRQLSSGDLHRQIVDAQKQAAQAAARLNSPEFRRQMEAAQKQLAQASASFKNLHVEIDQHAIQQQIDQALRQAHPDPMP